MQHTYRGIIVFRDSVYIIVHIVKIINTFGTGFGDDGKCLSAKNHYFFAKCEKIDSPCVFIFIH